MKTIANAVLRGGVADYISYGLIVWAAFELGRLSVTEKDRLRAYAEGTMDAYKTGIYN